MKLYTYWRSSAAYRVRIGLNLKGLECPSEYVHLVRDGGEQLKPAYRSINPQGLVPSLVLEDGTTLTQSLAILEYLDEVHPEQPLLPGEAIGRARVRALAQTVACEIHPLNNLRVLKHLATTMGVAEEAKNDWYRHWVVQGFEALERQLADSLDTGQFCHGDTPGMADACLIPQVYNARRFEIDLVPYPTIARIDAACLALDPFIQAAPESQGDAQ
ncbi:MAG: maleylacetoacetate isomerase [Motiliproteus sp.]